MAAQHNRQKRIPTSCEPCRIRKIRCTPTSGPPPCETCVRRGVASRCRYAGRESRRISVAMGSPISPVSEHSASTTSVSNASLAVRVAHLEALLQAQTPPQRIPYVATADPSSSPRIHGRLSVTATGHVRFAPSSLYTNAQVNNPQQPTVDPIDLVCGPYPFSQKQSEKQTLLADLPPRGHCQQLKDVFFRSFASLFHILHNPTFEQQYAEFEEAPDTMPLAWLALLYTVLGTAVIALQPTDRLLHDISRHPTASDRIAELSERYRNAAMKCLEADNYLWQQNITTLQALIILIYSINHSHGQAWTLLGMTYHIALSLGCHVDPSEFDLDVVSCEERRRCWAGVMMLYMIQNSSLGQLGPDPQLASKGVRLPADLNDFDFTSDMQDLPLCSEHATQMSYLLFKFRLYDISRQISLFISEISQPSQHILESTDKSILDEQQKWQTKYLVQSASTALPAHHDAHFNILQGYSHQLILLLHNHILRTIDIGSPQYNLSMSRSMDSAKELLYIHELFSTSVEMQPFSWYFRGICSFHAYHAAVSILAILAKHPLGECHGELLSLVEACAYRFETISDFSIVSQKAAPVIRTMSSAVRAWKSNFGQVSSFDQSSGQSHPSQNQSQNMQKLHSSLPYPSLGRTDMVTQESQNVLSNVFDNLDPQFWLSPSCSLLSDSTITSF